MMLLPTQMARSAIEAMVKLCREQDVGADAPRNVHTTEKLEMQSYLPLMRLRCRCHFLEFTR